MKTTVTILLVLAVVGGAGAWYWQHNAGPSVNFRTAEVTRGDMVPTISASGTLEPRDTVDVGAQVAGQILSFGKDLDGKSMDYGSRVDETTILANIDPMIYKADQDTAQASLAQARAGVESALANKEQMQAAFDEAKQNWEWAQPLLGTEAISKTQGADYEAKFKTAKANLAVADAAIATAKATVIQDQAVLDKAIRNVGYCTISSPIKGVIIDRRVNVGQTVVSSLNTPSLFLIAKDLTQIQVWVSVNEADIGNVYPGQPVTFTVSAHPNETFKGVVGMVRLNATMTQNVVTYTVVIDTQNADGRLFPYMTANVQFEVSRQSNVLLVPNSALRWFPQPEMVAPDVREAMAKKTRSAGDASDGGNESTGDDRPQHGRNVAATAATTRPAHTVQYTHGTIWIVDGKYVRPVKVRAGDNDGINTEVVVKNDELKEGEKVVTGEIHATADDAAATNPFAPKIGKRK